MNIDPYILAFSAMTVIATIWMGFRSAKSSKTASDFFVAGRSVSVGWNASAISGEYLSAASFMGIAGMVMSSGYDALWYPVCYACGYLFLLLFIAGPLRRFGAYTIPDFAEGRFDSPVFRKIAVVFVLFIGFFYTMPQMKGAGTTLAYIFPGLPYWVGVVLVGAVITLNVALGGMKGITLVQAFQYWMKMFAISVPIFVLMAVHGHYGKQVGMNFSQPKSDAPGKETFSPMTWKVTSINGNTNRWLLKLDETKSTVSRLRGKAPTAFGDLDAFTVLRLFAENNNLDRILLAQSAPNLGQLTNKIYVAAASSLEDWERDARLGLRSNGVDVVITSSALVVVPAARITDYENIYKTEGISAFEPKAAPRQPLPAKAPADSTWLNPFGPLTTKAARNAAAAIAKQSSSAGPDFILVASPNPTARAGSAALKAGLTNIASPLPANTLMNIERALTRISEVFGVDTFRTADAPKTINGADSTELLGYENGFAFIRQTLAQSGVALLQEGNSVYAVPAGRADFYKTRLENARSPIPLRANLAPDQRLTVNLESPSVAQALAVYSDLTDRQLVPQTNSAAERLDDALAGALSRFKLISRPGAPDSGVRIHGDGSFTAAEVKGILETFLRTNGLALVPAGEKAFAVQRLPVTFASDVEKAWLAKHEKPLALLYTYSLIIAIVCGTAGLPHILVRFYTNPDGTAAKRTTMWVMILIGVFYVFPPVFGVMGRNLLPSLYAGSGAKGTDKVVLELPRVVSQPTRESVVQGSGTNTLAQSPAEVVYSPNAAAKGLTPVPLPAPAIKKQGFPWGSILSGITCAGAFAAFMSTFSGLLVSMTGALAHDVYGRILRPKASPEQRMRMFKISAVLIGTVAVVLGSFVEPLQINFMVGQAFAIAAASYFPLLFMSVWWRGMTMKGAATGMLSGGICALFAVTITNFSDLKWINLADFWAAHPLLRILCEQPAIWTVPLAIALMVIVSKLTKREVPSDSRMKMLVLHAPEQLGLKQEYIQEHQAPAAH